MSRAEHLSPPQSAAGTINQGQELEDHLGLQWLQRVLLFYFNR